jgi:hypothetical protein
MKRAAVEKLRTINVWRAHLRTHRGESMACVCELQAGRFRKSERVSGCGNPRCWVCHSNKLGRVPQRRQLQAMATFSEGLAESLLANNTLEADREA